MKNNKLKNKKGDGGKMVNSNVQELKNIESLFQRINKIKNAILKRIISLDKKENEQLTEYEVLMKEYYSKNASRHIEEAENSILLANEAEREYKKNSFNWSDK